MTCSECVRLRQEYEAAIATIHKVVNSRFDNPWPKIRRLREKQEARDAALQNLYEHSQTHAARCSQPSIAPTGIAKTSYRKVI